MAHRGDYDNGGTRTLSATRADLEALIPVIEGKLPLILEANRMDEIDAALTLAHDYNLKLMIVGGAEAWLSADRLAAAQVPVLTGRHEQHPFELCDAESATGKCRVAAPRGCPRGAGRNFRK